MRIEHLESFVAVCDQGGFTKAAEALRMTQPAISRHIATLEAETGCRLLKRTTRSLDLTEEGQLLLPHAKSAIREIHEALDELQSLHARREQKLTIGHSFLYMSKRSIQKQKDFQQQHPDIDIVATERSNDELIELVASGRLDLAFVGATSFAVFPASVSSFVNVTANEKILVSKTHRLASKPHLSASDLAGETIVYPNVAPSRSVSLVRDDVERQGIDVAFSFTSYEGSALRLVEMGEGILDVPEFYEVANRAIVEIPYESDRIIMGCLIWNETNCSNTTREFIRFACE